MLLVLKLGTIVRAAVLSLVMLMGFHQFSTRVQAADDVIINEFMASNVSGLKDEDGDASDWIELWNRGSNSVNLLGWRLTDSSADLGKWLFPSRDLEAGAFLVVFASGKDRTNAAHPFHTSFSLSAGGEYLALARPDGSVAAEFAPNYPAQYNDISYGIAPTVPPRWQFLAVATPGKINGTNAYAKVATPQFSVPRGFYETALSVALTCATPGATLRYTLNGSAPSPSNGTAYSQAVKVSSTTVLRAAAFLSGAIASDFETHTYIFVRDVIRQSPTGIRPSGWPATWGGNVVDYGMDPNIVNVAPWRDTLTNDLKSIPTLSIVMNLPDLFDRETGIYANAESDGIAWERPVSLERLDPAGDRDQQFQVDAGVRIRGGFSRSSDDPKHSFRFFFRSTYRVGKLVYRLFGPRAAATFDKFDLRTNQDDSWHFTGGNGEILRDTFSRDCLLAMGRTQTHGSFYHLYINGQYWGLYTTEERPEAGFSESYFGGNAEDYDTVKVDPGPYDTVATDGNLDAWFRLWRAATNGLADDAAYQRIQGNNSDGTPHPDLENLVDVPDLIDYMLVIIYTGNLDAPASIFVGNNNWFGSRNRDNRHGGFRFFLHDSENSLYDVNQDQTVFSDSGDPTKGSGFDKSNPQYLWQRLQANREFRVLVGDHVQRHFFNEGALTVAAVTNRYRARRLEIDRAVVAESARWGDAQREPPFTYDDWKSASDDLLENYFPRRTAIVLRQLQARGLYPDLPAPVFSQRGGRVPQGYLLTIDRLGVPGTLYFTTDGGDPRRRGGGLSPTARVYTEPIAITTGMRVEARVRAGTNWSALVEADFYPSTDDTRLAVTEIMYNPLLSTASASDELEFLELQNAGPSPIDLSGYGFASGIIFAFTNGTLLTPGQFFVVVRNPTNFAAEYPATTVDGVYEGKLANDGERLQITNNAGTSVLSVSYAPTAPWPAAANGLGFSLVNTDPLAFAAPDDPRHWRASARPGGSPGAVDPEILIPPVVINEVLTHSMSPQVDAIELFNSTSQAVDLAGWLLTDDPMVPKKFRLPPGSLLPAGGYGIWTEADFNRAPGAAGSFSLSASGEQVYLFSGDAATNLTGYSHGFAFGAAPVGVSVGRYVNSAGEEQFPLQTSATLGASNSGPRFGPVVINEIHFHPAAGSDEFVELLNLSSDRVLFSDPVFPTNHWRLGGLDYTFPTNASIAPNGLALIVDADPATFRAKYLVPIAVPIFGPFAGGLQDSGERLELQRPDAPNTNGHVPYIAVDAVRYNDRSPWPFGADGAGPSLQRLVSSAYGDDPTNWFASGITPGRINAFNSPPEVSLTRPSIGDTFSSLTSIPLMATAFDRDGWVVRVEFFANESKVGELTNAPYQLNWTNAPPGVYRLSARAGDNLMAVAASDEVPIVILQPIPTTLVFAGSEWRYLDDGSDAGTNWIRADYDDHSWSSGPAQLGYGDGGEATVVSYGPDSNNKFVTTYFRRQFVLANLGGIRRMTIRLLRDDGAIIYLNGRELWRDNMPDGSIDYQTLASSLLGLPDEDEFIAKSFDPSLLREGTNILAVEIHQGGPGSSDISFDLALEAERDGELDTDGDGMPDAWESAHGLNPLVNDAGLDPDQDGASNLEEFLAGTDPQNAASHLQLRLLPGPPVPQLEFLAGSHRTYSILWRQSLAPDSGGSGWLSVTEIPPALTNRTIRLPSPAALTNQQGFFRLWTAPQR